MRILFLILFSFFFFVAGAQQKVTFSAEDGLEVTADLYETNSTNPYIVLLHQAGYSRGEYRQTASKLLKFGYNCLAVDLRSGGEVNYIQNHTALLAVQQGYPTDFLSSRKDIEAAIEWVKERNKESVVLFGSSFSASVSLLVAKSNPDIKAVIAFSPGEYFTPEFNIKPEIKGFEKPLFAASAQRENEYVNELLNEIPSSNKTIFTPSTGGEHGSKALWESNPNSQEYWLALTMFFSKIR